MDSAQYLVFDSVVIVPSSISIPPYKSGKDYTFSNDTLYWHSVSMEDSVYLMYRTLAIDLVIQHKDPKAIHAVFEENPFEYIPESEFTPGNVSSLQTVGNVSRGIGFGNAQDVVVNSNLNLKINGTLANDVRILAAISDEDNPIQPEGNTQQLQDFDQVYITLSKDSFQMTVGDFLMQSTEENYFLSYNKRSRGLQLSNVSNRNGWTFTSGGEAAISRGRFSRNQIDGIDGNLGPYRLSGINGEIFIIVISGTENVYLDGKKLVRGESNDYVINYNTGEITFTPNVLITRYSRIVVEFQYSDRNYARSVMRTGVDLQKNGWSVYGHVYNEMDLKNQPFLQDLQSIDSLTGLSSRAILSEAGDEQATISNVRKLSSFNPQRIMYRKIDSLGTDIFVHTLDPNSDSVFYEVVFTLVGEGKGSYRQVQSSANGKVFSYVGGGQGDYDPINVLVAPNRMNMYSFGLKYQSDNQSSGLEISMSQLDKNTLSSLNDGDNSGYGLKTFNTGNFYNKDSSWKMSYSTDYEWVGAGFNYVERYRDVEFNRRWNKVVSNPLALSQIDPSMEHIVNAGIMISRGDSFTVNSRVSSYIRPESFKGTNALTEVRTKFKSLSVGSMLEWLESNSSYNSMDQLNQFLSGRIDLEQGWKNSMTGLVYIREKSDFITDDSLLFTSYGFDYKEVYHRSNGESLVNYKLSLNRRVDERPSNNELKTSTIGDNAQLELSYTSKKYNQILLQTTYRNLHILDTSISESALDKSLQTRLELDVSMFKNLLRTRTFAQIASGQEQKREFQYLQVLAGNGIYIWNDYDSNGIKTLDEFEIASSLDRARADHIRIYTPIPGFIATRTAKLSESFEINPAAVIKAKNGAGGLVKRFYSLSTVLFEQKALPGYKILNGSELADTSLISRSGNLRTSFFFNRSSPKFGLEFTAKLNQSKVLLTNGFDSRSMRERQYKLRWNFMKNLTLRMEVLQGNKLYSSEFFSQRNYDFTYIDILPLLQFQWNNSFRLELKGSYFTASNQESLGGETTNNLQIGTGLKYMRAQKGSFQMDVSYVKVDYKGQVSSALGYELLRGLQNGNNATWNVSYQQRLAGNIQMTVNYEGRTSQNAPVIHMGRLMARYLF